MQVEALVRDLSGRTGRSILQELTDEKLHDLVNYIKKQFNSESQEII
jgi:hypothetical protein